MKPVVKGVDIMGERISNENAELIGRPIIKGVIDAHLNADYDRIVELIPGLPKEDFDKAISKLRPMGKVVSIEYLGQLKKIKEHLLLWKVSYELGEEEILWHLYLSDSEAHARPVGLLFDL